MKYIMEAIEFKTRVKDGKIQIPEKYRNQFSDCVRVVLMREEEPDSDPTLQPNIGSAKGEVWMSEDFDEPLDMFEDYGPTQ